MSSKPMKENTEAAKKIAIIGGGIAGLACAVALAEREMDFVLFEKEGRVGGKLRTDKLEGYVVEAGPDSFLPEKPWSVDLIRKVGLASEMLCSNDEKKGTFIYSKGRLHPLPEGVMLMVPTMVMPLLRSRLISWPGKIRMGLELFVPPRLDEADESLAEFVTRRLGRECLEKIAEPLVAGIHTSNPDNMSVLATFPRFVEMERRSGSLIRGMLAARKKAPAKDPAAPKMTYFMSLKEGMEELVEGCVSFVGGGRIRPGQEVTAVERSGSGYRLFFADGRQEEFAAVVIATPSFITKGLVRGMDEVLADQLDAIAWSSSATVSIAFRREDILKPLPGFGFIVPRVENRRINACTWSSIKWSYRAAPDRVLVRCFVGGGHHEELVSLDDRTLLAAVLAELGALAGLAAPPIFSRIYRWFNGMPKYTVGHLGRIAAIEERLKGHPGLRLIGCSYRGIGIGDCVRSGLDAASALAAYLTA